MYVETFTYNIFSELKQTVKMINVNYVIYQLLRGSQQAIHTTATYTKIYEGDVTKIQ